MKKIAVLGYGNIGSGVVEVIRRNQDIIAKRVGEAVEVKYVLDLRDFPGDPMEHKVVHDIGTIVNDPEIEIICETMGGNEPAFTFSKKALEQGKSVCTSNKELVANHGPELLELAAKNHCNYMFEASVGGGIPIIRPMNTALAPEKMEAITGILNGTTNYMLTEMEQKGTAYEDVLRQAQELGYAERNPEADVEGYDAGRKIAILCSLMAGKNVKYEDVYTEGITKLTAADFKYANKLNMSIKLLAMGKLAGADENGEETYVAMVAPCMLAASHPLSTVNEVFNAIFVKGNLLGETMYYGKGAGKLPTASAVVSDVIDCARHKGETMPCLWKNENVKMADMMDTRKRFFFRIKLEDAAKAADLFGSLARVDAGVTGECGYLTEMMTERTFAEKQKEVAMLGRIRVEA
ncbi:MAG: homoserine dehydrogenase [Lachnospiraceae bacterium]|nr:homoserine dehydrogenase [Lachnospiraceae bacterium]